MVQQDPQDPKGRKVPEEKQGCMDRPGLLVKLDLMEIPALLATTVLMEAVVLKVPKVPRGRTDIQVTLGPLAKLALLVPLVTTDIQALQERLAKKATPVPKARKDPLELQGLLVMWASPERQVQTGHRAIMVKTENLE